MIVLTILAEFLRLEKGNNNLLNFVQVFHFQNTHIDRGFVWVVSLYNGISSFVGFLMPKSSF